MREYYDREFKPEHPRKHSNFLSRMFFCYTSSIFRTGNKRDLDENDLTQPLDEHKSSIIGERLARYWNEEKRRAKENNEIPSLTKALARLTYKEILAQGIWLFIMEVPLRLCQPLFLGLFLRYFTEDNSKLIHTIDHGTYFLHLFTYWKKSPILFNEALFFAMGIVVCSLLNVFVVHPCLLAVMHVGMKLRVAICSVLYRKTLRLDLESLTGAAIGNVVTLMSNDVNRFDMAVMYLHYLWIAPVQMLVCLLLMYPLIGMASVMGISTMLAFIPLQAWFGNRTSRFRLSTAIRTDERVRQMNEIIQAMQVIKMYTWEYAFASQIHELRKMEMKILKNTSFIRGAILSFIMFITRLCIFATVVAMFYRGQNLTAEKVFIVFAFYQILRQTMTLFFPTAISQVAEMNVAISRVQRFLMLPESIVGDPRPMNPAWVAPTERKSSVGPQEPKIVLTNVSAKVGQEVCLQNVSVEFQNGQLAAVIGQVGAGKSSLLHVILREFKPWYGQVQVQGSISYACQEPWLFAGSVRQNILFGEEFEMFKYNEVVRACGLLRDFQLLAYGDSTIVGERGASLSGGQRARINLARAIYKDADIYLLDDPLSAVDTNVGKHLFSKCISGYLAGKIVILVTHQLQFLSDVSKVILMHNGRIEAEGSYRFLENTGSNFAQFLKDQLAVDSEEAEVPVPIPTVGDLIKELKIQSSLTLNIIDKEGQRFKPRQESETRTSGDIGMHSYKEYFTAGGNCCFLVTVAALFIGAQFTCSFCDYFLSTWIELEDRKWHNANATHAFLPFSDAQTYVTIYAVLISLTIALALTRSIVFYILCMRASINLHDRMFGSLIVASMKFFNTNTSGRILNRFSKDIGAVDELLPNAIIDATQIMLNLLGSVAVVVSINFYLALPVVVIVTGFYFLRAYYIRTSRSVKRLEGISKSPVFGHLNATIQGLTTIRSNGAEMILVEEFDALQDDHSSAWFMFIATSRAFGFWLDLICAGFIGIVSVSFLFYSTTASKVGLAITTAIGLTGLFQWGMRQSAEVANQMTSVERVMEYINQIEHEPNLESDENKKPPDDWPTEGQVQFQSLYMFYKPTEPPVLKNLNFIFQPKEKIGIVGRTGAGKSSLIGALFRLANFDGSVVIDSVNTKEIGLHDLRRKISIIPQEPVLFSGTLRYNMDPFKDYSDEDIVKALTEVESKAAVMEGPDCLYHHVSEGGVNISVGERQMICLARAILKNNRILVLDEATANIDPQTDKFIQATIRQKFMECTVLTIAHRLHTVMDSDRILVMDAGIAVEFDHPHKLLQNKFGYFSAMVEKTGKAMEKNLKEIAAANYKLKQERDQQNQASQSQET